MSKIKTLCNENFQGEKVVKFKAGSGSAAFILERKENVSSITLSLISNGSEVPLGSLFGGSQLEDKKLFKGEEYALKITSAGELNNAYTEQATPKASGLSVGVFWGAE